MGEYKHIDYLETSRNRTPRPQFIKAWHGETKKGFSGVFLKPETALLLL